MARLIVSRFAALALAGAGVLAGTLFLPTAAYAERYWHGGREGGWHEHGGYQGGYRGGYYGGYRGGWGWHGPAVIIGPRLLPPPVYYAPPPVYYAPPPPTYYAPPPIVFAPPPVYVPPSQPFGLNTPLR